MSGRRRRRSGRRERIVKIDLKTNYAVPSAAAAAEAKKEFTPISRIISAGLLHRAPGSTRNGRRIFATVYYGARIRGVTLTGPDAGQPPASSPLAAAVNRPTLDTFLDGATDR